jgi:hypothetical protein
MLQQARETIDKLPPKAAGKRVEFLRNVFYVQTVEPA